MTPFTVHVGATAPCSLCLSQQDGLGKDAVLGVIPKALTPREISNELIGDTKVLVEGVCWGGGAFQNPKCAGVVQQADTAQLS